MENCLKLLGRVPHSTLLQRRGRQDTVDSEQSNEDGEDQMDEAGAALEEIGETADDDPGEEQGEEHTSPPSAEKKIERKRVQRQDCMPVGVFDFLIKQKT